MVDVEARFWVWHPTVIDYYGWRSSRYQEDIKWMYDSFEEA